MIKNHIVKDTDTGKVSGYRKEYSECSQCQNKWVSDITRNKFRRR